MEKWVATGISGSGRIELLEALKAHSMAALKKTVMVHDIGLMLRQECARLRLDITDERFLDADRKLLQSLRSSALKEVRIAMLENPSVDLHLVGVHAAFRWKHRIIPGISYADVVSLEPTGFVNVVRNVRDIVDANRVNPKWDAETIPGFDETQQWLMEEEFVTEVLSDVVSRPMYLVSRDHNIPNLADLFFSRKKMVYLSYPITSVREADPELLARIQGPVLQRLEELFVVFNPLAIKDMRLTYDSSGEDFPELVDQLTPRVKEILKKRTIERDFQFIDQSDAVVVFYLTDKLSPGVLAEIYYAHRNQKPVFIAFPSGTSPFLEDVAEVIEADIDRLMPHLEEFAKEERSGARA